ncbi:hypothetical protein CYANOKiyG1_42390 [Okeania sp. KiyG1]|nr:hypothetical protein CYANOKiyG1_42390 [Okeania sp. KiyG1]
MLTQEEEEEEEEVEVVLEVRVEVEVGVVPPVAVNQSVRSLNLVTQNPNLAEII